MKNSRGQWYKTISDKNVEYTDLLSTALSNNVLVPKL